MPETNDCPCCGRHCDLREPHCDRGREYLRTGAIPERAHEKPQSIRGTVHYSAMDTEDKLVMNLRDIGHMIRFLYEGKGSQKRVLIILLERGKMTQRELTERLGIQPGSASEVIGKLENAGLILRTPSPEDRRTADILLTESGRQLAQEAVTQRKQRHREMFSCMTEEEKQMLLALTEKLNRDWDSRYREGENGFAHDDMHKRGHGFHSHGPHGSRHGSRK